MVLSGENGAETMKTMHYRVPVGAPAGHVYLTVADASTANLLEFQVGRGRAGAFAGAGADAAERSALEHQSVRAGVARRAVLYRGRPRPAGSAAVARDDSGPRRSRRGATLAESRAERMSPRSKFRRATNLVTGSKTIQIEVKE